MAPIISAAAQICCQAQLNQWPMTNAGAGPMPDRKMMNATEQAVSLSPLC
jgi:hypothetical protein